MKRVFVAVVAVALSVVTPGVEAAHDFGQTGVNSAFVGNVVQLTYPGSPGTPAGWFGGADYVQCWGPYPWSGGGSMIVLTSQVPGECTGRSCNEIVVMNADGSGVVRLTENTLCDSHASFVPPGASVVVFQEEQVDDLTATIHSVNVATKVVTNLTEAHAHVAACPGESNYTENKPAVSPDGQHIAYRSCDASLWVMDIDGTDPIEIVAGGSDIHHHAWDPTGTWLVYAAGCDGSYSMVYRARADGSGDPELLADHSSTEQCANWPSWSPDGRWVAYHVGEGGTEEEDEGKAIWLVDPETKARRLLVEGPLGQDVCGPTSWSPNSRYLAFKMDPDGTDAHRALYLADVATGVYFPLTDGYWDYRHWFSPSGAAILFRDSSGTSYCRDSRDGCQSSGDLLSLNLNNPAIFAGDAVLGQAIPAATPWGLLGLILLMAATGAILLLRRSN